MKKEDYNKATEIQEQIKTLEELRSICHFPYKRFSLIKSLLWIGTYNSRTLSVCDDGLTEVIRNYCNERIRELQDELEAL